MRPDSRDATPRPLSTAAHTSGPKGSSNGPCTQCRFLGLWWYLLIVAGLRMSEGLAEDGQSAGAGCATQPASARPDRPKDWFRARQDLKKEMEDTIGTHVGLCAITTGQAVLNGKGHGKERIGFWWNPNVTQELWPRGKLITNTRDDCGISGTYCPAANCESVVPESLKEPQHV